MFFLLWGFAKGNSLALLAHLLQRLLNTPMCRRLPQRAAKLFGEKRLRENIYEHRL